MSAIPIPTPILDPAQAALAAPSRGGLRAAEEAQRANTYMVVEKKGKVLDERPEEYLRKRQQQTTPSTTKNND